MPGSRTPPPSTPKPPTFPHLQVNPIPFFSQPLDSRSTVYLIKITHIGSAIRTASFWGNSPFQKRKKFYMMVRLPQASNILEAWNSTCNRSIFIPIRPAQKKMMAEGGEEGGKQCQGRAAGKKE